MAVGVDILLRATTDGFTAGMAKANNAVMDLKKGLREFDVGNGLKSLLGVGGVIAAFRSTIEHARELRDALEEAGKPVPEAVASVSRLGDAIGAAATYAKNTAVNVLGIYTSVGDGVRRIIQNVSAAQEAAAEKAARTTGEAADAAEKRLAEARKANLEKIAAAENGLAEVRRKNALEAMDTEDRLAEMAKEINKLRDEQATKGKESLRYKELALEIEQKSGELAKEQAKYAADEEKFREGIYKANDAMAESLADIKKTESDAAKEKKQAAKEAAIAAQEEYNASVKLTEEKRQQAQLDEQRARSWAGMSGPLGQRDLDQVSTDVLKAQLDQRSRALEAQRVAQGPTRGVGGSSFESINFFEYSQLNSIRQELAFRESFQRAFARGGRQGALNEYISSGRRAEGFDVALSNMASWGDTLTASEKSLRQSSEDIAQIKNVLTNVFR